MCRAVCAFFLLAVTAVLGFPAKDELMFDMGGDTAVVESTVRETRAVVPEHIEDLIKPGVKKAYIHLYGNDDKEGDDEQGYSKKTNDKGADGYKHYDTYQKKDSDKYGYEKHSEYGNADYAKAGDAGKSGKYKKDDEDGGDETKHTYNIVEGANSNGKKKGIESYEGGLDGGFYGDGDSGSYSEGSSGSYTGGESASYNDGDSGSYSEGDGDSGHYEGGSEGGSSHYTAEGDDGDGEGESESYTAEEEEDEDY